MSGIRTWVDGRLVPVGTPALRVDDHGLTVGDGAFETAKVVDGRPFALSRHLARMDRTLAGLGLPAADHAVVRAGVDAVLGAGEPVALGRLRWTVTGGVGPLGSDRYDSPLTYVVGLATQPPTPASGAVVTVPWTRNERSATAGLKTTSYADNVVALAAARERGATEALFANTRGELCEGTGSNVVVVVDGVARTPALSSGCLAGITRELTLEWCAAAGVELREEVLPIGVLETCDEVFLTSSTRDVFAVSAVDGRPLGAPGPVTAEISGVFLARAAEDLDP